MMSKKLIFTFLLLLAVMSAAAQRVSNVLVYQEGKSIVITYDLSENASITVSGVGTAPNSRNGYESRLNIRSVKGDVGKYVRAGNGRRIEWNVLQDYGEKFFYDDLSITVTARPTWKTFFLLEGAYSFAPEWGAGLMIGQVKQWGWYVKARSNFQFKAMQKTEYEAGEGGVVRGDGERTYNEESGRWEDSYVLPFYSGKKQTTEFIADAGTLVRLGCPLYLYAGIGFGMRQVQWETTDGQWIKYSPGSLMGFSGDIGLMGCIKGFTISAGVNTINFKYMEIEAGIGWMF